MSAAQPPSIELLQGSPGGGESPRRPVRLGVFLVTFLVCAALGLAFTYLRPPVYQTSATVLTVKPKGVDQPSADADIEHVAIQRRLLLGDDVLERLAAALRREGHDPGRYTGAGGLRAMLAVLPVPDTNLVELRAEGGSPSYFRKRSITGPRPMWRCVPLASLTSPAGPLRNSLRSKRSWAAV